MLYFIVISMYFIIYDVSSQHVSNNAFPALFSIDCIINIVLAHFKHKYKNKNTDTEFGTEFRWK